MAPTVIAPAASRSWTDFWSLKKIARPRSADDALRFVYSVFDLNVQVESTTGGTGITGKSKTKHPRVPRGLLFLNTQVKNALIARPRGRSGAIKQIAPHLLLHLFSKTAYVAYGAFHNVESAYQLPHHPCH
jgi:hypothetical protein